MAKAFVHAGTDKTLKMFGEAVRDLRKMQGLSQEAFADLIGVDRSYMGGIERGDPNVALINIQRTAVALDMKIGIKPIQIYRGSPWENGYNERFNGVLRQELLNAEWLHNVKQAQVAINIWLREYNYSRPHHALGMRPPVPETVLEKSQISGTKIGG